MKIIQEGKCLQGREFVKCIITDVSGFITSSPINPRIITSLQVNISKEQCEKLIQEFEPCPNVKQQNMMSIDGKHSFQGV